MNIKVKSFEQLDKALKQQTKTIYAINAEGLQVMKDYINDEYIHQHKPDLSTDRLKQISKNIESWIIQLQTSKPLTSKKNISSTLAALRDTQTAINNRIADRKQPVNLKQETLTPLDDDVLRKVFNVIGCKRFKKLEKRLLRRNYLNENRGWQDNPVKLVDLILCLQDCRYFNNNIPEKQIKDFFQSTYGVNITQQWKPGRRNKRTAVNKKEFIEIAEKP